MVTYDQLLEALGTNIAIDPTHYGTKKKPCINGLCTDSRDILPGDVFVCLKGLNYDGHNFTEEACQKKCSIIIADKHHRPVMEGKSTLLIYVANTDLALARLVNLFYPNPGKGLKIIGITGTKGKTTTAIMIKKILEAEGHNVGYIGTNGAIFADQCIQTVNTTPGTLTLYRYLEMMRQSRVKYVVLEVSSQGLWKKRIAGLSFEVTVFTNIYEDHIGGVEHPSFEHYFTSKAQLFTQYESKHIVYNADDMKFRRVFRSIDKNKLVPYSMTTKIGAYAYNAKNVWDRNGFGVSCICVNADGTEWDMYISMLGVYNVYNALAAACVCETLGVPSVKIRSTLRSIFVDGRSETFETASGAVFVIDYAHNEESITKALTNIREYDPNRLFCVVGSVGGRSQSRRYGIGKAAALYADYTILTADNPNFESIAYINSDIRKAFADLGKLDCCEEHFDRRNAIARAYSMALEGDIVLLAGKGHERYQLISGKNYPFCEREILEELDRQYIELHELSKIQ